MTQVKEKGDKNHLLGMLSNHSLRARNLMSLTNSLLHTDTCCVILSGGISLRMNRHKALLPFSTTENFLERIISVYKNFGVAKIIVVVNEELFKLELNHIASVVLIKNEFPEKGRLFSLQLACNEMTSFKYSFVQAIDNPFVNTTLLESLWENRENANYITPVFQNIGGHPFLINKIVTQELKKENNFNKTIKEILSAFSRIKVNTLDNACLININTTEEYELYLHNKL